MESQQNATAAPKGGQIMSQTGAQNISLNTKFLCGLKGDVKMNIHFIDNQNVLYPCGHNIVIYNTDDRSQRYIPGIEGSEGISAVAVSPSKKFLAVCERSERAICLVYDVQTMKRRKVLTSTDYNSREFVSVAFAPTNEKSLLATLTGEQDIRVILWTWDKAKCFAQQQIGISGNSTVTQVSFSNQDQNTVLVTGNSSYKFYKVGDNNILKPTHTSILKKDQHISNNYTCHTWLPDGRLLVCTDQGEIMLLESNGDFKMLLTESPGDGFFIECIQTFQKGFIIAGDNGTIIIYEKAEEVKNPYNRIAKLPQSEKQEKGDYHDLQAGIMNSRIRCLALSSSDDIIFTTENNQIMKVSGLQIDRPNDDCKYEYLIFPFHSRAIQGMDICIKKNLVATCSIDKTVRIWHNTNPPQLEICELFNDEAYSVALHPSGFHLIVGFTDRVRMMNVFQKSLKSYQTIAIKGCREIRFSNGGHLFACASQSNINVYKFYTGENTQDMIYKAHLGPVRCLHWFDDDSGFISGGWDGNVFSWKLYTDKKEPKDVNPKSQFTIKNFQFACVTNKPDSKSVVYAAGIDKTIKRIEDGNLTLTYEAGSNISQIQIMHGGRALFAGIAENDKPGSIQIINFNFQKIFEVQAHSLPIERLRVTQDNSCVFSAGQDGVFGIFSVSDKDPNKKEGKEYSQITQSEEILIEKQERDKFQADIEHLKSQIEIAKQNKEASVQQELDKKNKKISELSSEIENKEIENNNRYEQLLEAKKEMERMNKDKIYQMQQSHGMEMDKRKQDYDEKMDADLQRFNELQAQKDEDTRKFEERLNELSLHHEKIIKELKQDQRIQLNRQTDETNRLKKKIELMMQEHKEEREKIESDTWEKIDELKDKNKEELAKIIDQGMQSKCNLTLIHNDFKNKKNERDREEKGIEKLTEELNELFKSTNNLKQQIESQKSEISERDTTIKDKDKRIIDLKKKTQELEKFKFVLDYKIKELKRDIGPREIEIQKLNEQTNKMRQELKHFNRVNQNLALIVDDLRMRQEGLTNEVKGLRQQLDDQENYKRKFKDDVFEVLHHITDFKKLKAGVIRLHKKYVLEEVKNEAGDGDLHREYANKRRYLENNVNYLRQMLQKDQDVHKKENSKIMGENVYLLQEINDQKKECHALKQKIKQNKIKIKQYTDGIDDEYDGLSRELKMQDMQIEELTRQIHDYEQNNDMMRQQRPHVGQLPPLDQQDQNAMYQQQYDQQQAEQMAMQQAMDMEGMEQQQPAMEAEAPVEAAQPEAAPAENPPAEQPPADATPAEEAQQPAEPEAAQPAE